MAKQRHEMHKTMLSLIERSSRSNSNDDDDKLDLSFASLAMRIRHNFTLSQREAIHTEIINLVNTTISNKEKGMPVITPRFQGFQLQAPTPQVQQGSQVQQVQQGLQVQQAVQVQQMDMAAAPAPPQMQPTPQIHLLNYGINDSSSSYMDLLQSDK